MSSTLTPIPSLTDRLRRFLASSGTNVEIIDDELRSHIDVDLGLRSAIEEAIQAQKTVIVAGTAGSGKSHLLRSFSDTPLYRFVPDLTDELARSKQLLERGPVIVAANEGALFLGKKLGYLKFDQAIEILHRLQRGQMADGGDLVLIDVAALDPASNNAVSKMLELPIIRETGEFGDEARKLGWNMLSGDCPVARTRLSQLIAEASGKGEAFTFRKLWQFVGHIVLSDELWVDCLLSGDNEVSRRLSALLSPSSYPMPHIAGRLWHGDLLAIQDRFTAASFPLVQFLASNRPRTADGVAKETWHKRLRLVSLFGLKENPWSTHEGPDLWNAVRRGEVAQVIRRINRYMTYDSIESGDDLDLWIQYDTERRDEKPSVQVSVARASGNDFVVRRNGVVSSGATLQSQMFGDRHFLVHVPTSSVLTLDRGFVSSIELPRSSRMRDRSHVETDWRLLRFFSQVAGNAKQELRTFAVTDRKGVFQSWRLSIPLGVAN